MPSARACDDHVDPGGRGQARDVQARAGDRVPVAAWWPAQWFLLPPGMPTRPSRAATSPSWARPLLARKGSCACNQTGKPKVAAYIMARSSTCVSTMARLPGRKRRSRLRQFGHFGEALALQLHGQRADRMHMGEFRAARTMRQHFHQAGFVQHRVGVRRAGQARHAAGGGGAISDSSVARYSKPGSRRRAARSMKPGADDAARGVEHALAVEARPAPCQRRLFCLLR
jgi:hypothetical protein